MLIGANSLKIPHHIVILRFSEVVKGHANCIELKSGPKKPRNYLFELSATARPFGPLIPNLKRKFY